MLLQQDLDGKAQPNIGLGLYDQSVFGWLERVWSIKSSQQQ
jgi:hypothetical protein